MVTRSQTDKPISTAEELEKLNEQSASAARTEAKPFVPELTDDQLRKLAREKLSEALQAIDAVAQPELTRKLCAEVKDRIDGKPVQAVNQTTVTMSLADLVLSAHRLRNEAANGLIDVTP